MHQIRIYSLILTFLLGVFASPLFSNETLKKEVMVITVNGVINPVSSEYIGKSIKKASNKRVEALVIELDTPGGLDTSMRSIVKEIVGSEIPVVVFVAPGGARAA